MNDVPNSISKQFDRVSEEYDFVSELFNNNNLFISNMSSKKGRVLDIGCGSGILTIELSEHYKEVVGIDISEEMLSIARSKRQKDNISYIKMDANELFFDKTFDFIVSRATFHHLSDIQSVLNSMKSLLNKGGKIIILDNVSEVETPPRWVHIIGSFINFLPHSFKYGVKTSIRIFKHCTSKYWLEHLANDKYLSEKKYKEVYGECLPNCSFVKESIIMSVIWENK